ncbi:MAG: BMC domain-containing protein [Acidimicrobiia bacterium]
MNPALALLEFGSIAVGVEAGDAMVKQAPVETVTGGTVHPGKYLVQVTGDVASVEEAVTAGRRVGGAALLGLVYLPDVHPGVVAAAAGLRNPPRGDAIGVVETRHVHSAIAAADAGVKGASVTILELGMADGLGGKGFVVFNGDVADVQAAATIGAERVEPGHLVAQVVIPQMHPEMVANLTAGSRFNDLTGG